MVRNQPAQIKQIIAAAINKAGKNKQTINDIKQAWRGAAGKKAARHSCPVKLTKKTITVAVDSSVWMYYLYNKKDQLEQAINTRLCLDTPVKIRLRAGEHSDKTAHKKHKTSKSDKA